MGVVVEEQNFFKTVQKAKEELKQNPHFQSEAWSWVHELDDEGFFIFGYLVHDYNQKVLTQKSLQETVYTLTILRHKLIPSSLSGKMAIPVQWQFQILFNLYEKLKREEMSWDDCQVFIDGQIQEYLSNESKN